MPERFLCLAAALAAPATAALATADPQSRSPWVDSTHITGLAQRVLPDAPAAPPGGGNPEPDPPPPPPPPVRPPASVDELLAAMNGAQLYVDVLRPHNLPSFVRVDVFSGSATVKYASSYSRGGDTPWDTVCTLAWYATSCTPDAAPLGIVLGTFTVSPEGFGWSFQGVPVIECPGSYNGRPGHGEAKYSYADWSAGRGQFFNFGGTSLSGRYFSDAWLQPTACDW